jgi:hypothetical protein
MTTNHKPANRTGIYRQSIPQFFVKPQKLSDLSEVFNIYLKRDDSECLCLIESAVSEAHAYAICDDLNKVLELRGVRT